jgi:hypothetical protein
MAVLKSAADENESRIKRYTVTFHHMFKSTYRFQRVPTEGRGNWQQHEMRIVIKRFAEDDVG